MNGRTHRRFSVLPLLCALLAALCASGLLTQLSQPQAAHAEYPAAAAPQDKDAVIAALQAEVEELHVRLSQAEAQLAALAARLDALDGGGAEAALPLPGNDESSMSEMALPPVTPTPTPQTFSAAEDSLMENTLHAFFYFWHMNNQDGMLALTAPSWRAEQSNPETALFTLLANCTAGDDLTIVRTAGGAEDTLRTVTVHVTISRPTGAADRYAFTVVMLQEDGMWYVDPRSVGLNAQTRVSATATPHPTPTQPVLVQGHDGMTLYYNPDGGSKYHIDPNCPSVSARYLPMTGQLLYSQLNEQPYVLLSPCAYCGAPLGSS